MLELVKQRLADLGFATSNEPGNEPGNFDDNLLLYAIEKVEFYIQARTNLKLVPDELTNVAIDMAVGEFLFAKHASGQLDLSRINFEAVIKRVQDGDTDVTYAVSDSYSPEALFNIFIEQLRHGGVKWSDYRVIKW